MHHIGNQQCAIVPANIVLTRIQSVIGGLSQSSELQENILIMSI